ncbi:DUF447 domain-containing protein [uncultured Methanobrevibacter sp.]|uniref:DUF447 domain-containing protein n=1 Tax=uncultured Methanobrevibacter sp. TaxID=253161 RepID=UPI002620FD31|nr:DUF447 domain-containing protein [uncultured Methanobrevibacter sp.]
MQIDLSLIGMEKGKQYETIITTHNSEGVQNAAPIGVICSGPDKVVCRIFKGSHTLDNICSQREFVVNITHNSELFYKSTLGNLPEDQFISDDSIKGIQAYFKCEVTSLKQAVKRSDPIKKKDEAIVIKADVVELNINSDVKAFNRGFGHVIESLSNYSRFDLVDDAKKQSYIESFREAKRVVRKIGYREDIKAMKAIEEKIKEKGYDV